jgi:hypothetical protein
MPEVAAPSPFIISTEEETPTPTTTTAALEEFAKDKEAAGSVDGAQVVAVVEGRKEEEDGADDRNTTNEEEEVEKMEEEDQDEFEIESPLKVGVAVMAQSRGFDKWFSGGVSKVRLGSNSNSFLSSLPAGAEAAAAAAAVTNTSGGGGGEWVYGVKYACVEVGRRKGQQHPALLFDTEEESVCGALIAPISTG